jgi:hypothetical protein
MGVGLTFPALCLLAGGAHAAAASASESPPSEVALSEALWPLPQQLVPKAENGGYSLLYEDWVIAFDTENYNDTFAASELRDFLLAKTNDTLRLPLVPLRSVGVGPRCSSPNATVCKYIAIGDPAKDAALQGLVTDHGLSMPADLDPDEGYVLDVANQQDPQGSAVFILASSAAGRYFGVQTLIQMLNTSDAAGGTLKVPGAHIVDWPDMKIRGFLMSGLGEKAPTPFFYADAERMTRGKMNFAFLEFMANIPYTEGGYQMMLDIQAHCKKRHMYIVPQVPAGAPCGEIDTRSNEGMWARAVPFLAMQDGGGIAPGRQGEVKPVPAINGGFDKLGASTSDGGSEGVVGGGPAVPPAGWEFLPSASGEQSWVVDSQTKLSGAHSVRALLSELSLSLSLSTHTLC